MTFAEYQELASKTRSNEYTAGDRTSLAVNALGLAGEAGEICDHIKKHLGHRHTLEDFKIIHELGDILWYVSEMAFACGYPLEEIAERNIAKLKERYPEGFSTDRSLNRPSDVTRG